MFVEQNIFRKKIFLGTLFRKIYFHEKICFGTLWFLIIFFFKRNNFSEFLFFSKKILVANFMRFRKKRLEKQTHIDTFSLKKI